MRLDYALYGLAAVLFVLAAVILIYPVFGNQLLFTVSTAIVGLLCLIGGFFLRPKDSTDPTSSTLKVPNSSLAVEAPKAEPVSAETASSPIPLQASPVINAPFSVEESAQKTSMAVADQESSKDKLSETPAGIAAFSQIRGINEKRVDQLRANGINTMEDLANASADELAEKLSLSPKIVKMWIGSAKKIVK